MNSLFSELEQLSTEQRNPRTMALDSVGIIEALEMLHAEDRLAVASVETELPYIASAVKMVVDALHNDGRLIYVGAGTSGRLGVLDAAECPPTFGTEPDQIRGLIAGGDAAMFRAQEGAEDLEENGEAALKEIGLSSRDIVCGIAASKRTPYVVGALNYARSRGAGTIFVTCNPRSSVSIDVDVAICPDVGPEPLMGSTRMKSGTATKLVLNMISTVAMVRLGKVYENMMVDLQPTNQKLFERSRRIVMIASGVDYSRADQALKKTGGHVKTALVMLLADIPKEEAEKRLLHANGFVKSAVLGP